MKCWNCGSGDILFEKSTSLPGHPGFRCQDCDSWCQEEDFDIEDAKKADVMECNNRKYAE